MCKEILEKLIPEIIFEFQDDSTSSKIRTICLNNGIKEPWVKYGNNSEMWLYSNGKLILEVSESGYKILGD